MHERDFIASRDGFWRATVGETGWPYVHFRGGPPGFLKAIDAKTLGFADFRGNVQYVSVGNLGADARIALILMDQRQPARLEILGREAAMEASVGIRLESDGAVCSFVQAEPTRDGSPDGATSSDGADAEPFVATRQVLCGLGACTAMPLRLYATGAGLDLGTITVGVTGFEHDGGTWLSRCVTFQRRIVERDRLLLAAVCEKTPWTVLLKRRVPLLTEVLRSSRCTAPQHIDRVVAANSVRRSTNRHGRLRRCALHDGPARANGAA